MFWQTNKRTKRTSPTRQTVTSPTATTRGFGDLPKELHLEIFRHLTGDEVLPLGEVCQTWRDYTNDPRLWSCLGYANKQQFILLKGPTDKILTRKTTKLVGKDPLSFYLVGGSEYKEKLFGKGRIIAEINIINSTKDYDIRTITIGKRLVIITNQKAIAGDSPEPCLIEKDLKKCPSVDVLLVCVTTEKDIIDCSNKLKNSSYPFIIFMIPAEHQYNFSQLPNNAVFLSQNFEPLQSIYDRILDKIAELAKTSTPKQALNSCRIM